MLNKSQLTTLLERIGNKVNSEIKIYLIGGCNLSLKELKPATKDIDLVLTSMKDFITIKDAMLGIGLKETTEVPDIPVYKGARVIFSGKDDSLIDVFVNIIASKLYLSDDMIERSELYTTYGKMQVYLVSNDDVFLFKSVTGREADIEDMNRLFNIGLKWRTILNECVAQNKKDTHWIFWLFEQVCMLEKKKNIVVRQKARILRICLEDWSNKPDSWMVDFSDDEIKNLIPEKESQEIIDNLKRYLK